MRAANQPDPTHADGHRVVVLVHSSASTPRQWDALALRLAPQHDVHTVTLLGHGGAVPLPGHQPLRLAHDAAQVEAILERCGRAHLIGHSYGGAVVLNAAARQPHRVASLVAYEPVLMHWLAHDPDGGDEYSELRRLSRECQLDLHDRQPETAARRFVSYWSGANTWAAMSARARQATAARMPAVCAQFVALFAEPPDFRAMHGLDMPMLLLRGSATTAPARRLALLARRAWPEAHHECLTGLGHMGPVTDADRVNDRIVHFLEEQATLAARSVECLAA